jgi:serine/threonine protein kinase
MNRGIDYRADFYALGVTLYQLLSGTLPFTSDDPLELVHCHIAQQPMPVNQVNPTVPKMVAAIIAKLMAKNAEDRYQSAIGLKHDSQQCLTQA